MTLSNRQTVNVHQKMQTKESRKDEARRLLTQDSHGVKPGDLLLFIVKRSRTGFRKQVKVYQVKEFNGSQHLLCLTRNIAVLMGCAKTEAAEHKAFNHGFSTDEGVSEFAHYLKMSLFGHDAPSFTVETINI